MLKQFLQEFLNKNLDEIQTIDGSIYNDFVISDVTDEYVYGYCQGVKAWVCIPFTAIISLLSRPEMG